MAKYCPSCGSVIYSRRAKSCGVCYAELPAVLRLTGQEAKVIAGQYRQAEQNIRRMEQEQRDESLRRGTLL